MELYYYLPYILNIPLTYEHKLTNKSIKYI